MPLYHPPRRAPARLDQGHTVKPLQGHRKDFRLGGRADERMRKIRSAEQPRRDQPEALPRRSMPTSASSSCTNLRSSGAKTAHVVGIGSSPLMQLSAAPEKFESKRVCSDKRLHEPYTPVHFCCSWSWRPLLCGLSNSTCPMRLSPLWIPSSSRPRRPVAAAVPNRVRSRPRAPPPSGRRAALYLFGTAQVGPSLRQPRGPRLGGSPPPRSPPSLLQDRPHLEPEGLRQYIHQVIALLSPTNKEGVIGDRRQWPPPGEKARVDTDTLARAVAVASPAHWGPPRKPIEGFWRGLKGKSGAGRCLPALHQLYQRMRQYSWNIKRDQYMRFPGSKFRLAFSRSCFFSPILPLSTV